ncbi:unnamed protein product [Adineta steineri]|uniref:Glutamate [NMDA] receptor subunit 1 n=3 Tax=Adineta steineri TaxID=433720 RepID=A0A813ZS33_9BILA|nr:unnamed protein product [Adineta steineri]
MNLFCFYLIFSIHFSVIKLETSDTFDSSTNKTIELFEFDNLYITILGALTNNEHITILNEHTNRLYRVSSHQEIYLSSQSFILDSNPLLIALKLCEIGNTSHAKAIIAGEGSDGSDLTLTAISYVSDFYHIPVLAIASRENLFSDKALYNYIVRLVPPYLYEADAWFSIIRRLKYTKVVLIYSQDEEGRMVASRFQMLTEDSEIQIERTEEYEINSNFTSIISNLTSEDRLLSRVFIIHARVEDTDDLLSAIVRLQHLENFVWIINERALMSNSSALFDGLLGVKLHKLFSEENLLIDAIKLLVNAFNNFIDDVGFWSDKKTAINCSTIEPWSYGNDFYRKLLNTSLMHGVTGNIEFNEEGDRVESLYEIINIQNGQTKVVGTYRTNTIDKTELVLDEQDLVWPNGLRRKPDGIRTRRNVSVVTIHEKPFTIARPGNDCDPTIEVLCPRKRLNDSINEEYENFCCRGYCIDLLQELSKNLSFVFTLHLVADNKYGSYEKEKDDKHKRWDGMIGELLNYEADMIIAPLTISPERAEDIEFTKPFKYQGITILVRKTKNASNLASFLQPFKDSLWAMVLLSVHVIAVVLYLLDRFSPFGRFRFSPRQGTGRSGDGPVIEINTEEDSLNLSRALWFTWGVLLNSGIGEGTPRSFSARVLGMVWAGFAMIMVASYTANLAAFLVLDRPQAGISGINDARLRNPQDGFTYATVKGSSVDMYFKRQVEFSTMYRTMESKNYLTAEDAIAELVAGTLKAFIWDSPRLEYEAAQNCDLVTAGELFGRSSYGIALRKRDAWINPLSHAILSFHEKGFMETLDNKWIFFKGAKQCSDPSSSPATLGVSNMLGVFLLVAGGIFAGFFLLAIEIAFKRRKERREKEVELSRNALIHWRKKIEKRRQRSIIFETDNQQRRQIVDTDLHNELPSQRFGLYKSSNKTNNLKDLTC